MLSPEDIVLQFSLKHMLFMRRNICEFQHRAVYWQLINISCYEFNGELRVLINRI